MVWSGIIWLALFNLLMQASAKEYKYTVLQFKATYDQSNIKKFTKVHCDEVLEKLKYFLPNKDTFCLEGVPLSHELPIHVYSMVPFQLDYQPWKKFYESEEFKDAWEKHTGDHWFKNFAVRLTDVLILQVHGDYVKSWYEHVLRTHTKKILNWVTEKLMDSPVAQAFIRVIEQHTDEHYGAAMYLEKAKVHLEPGTSLIEVLQYHLQHDAEAESNGLIDAIVSDIPNKLIRSAEINGLKEKPKYHEWNYKGVNENSFCSVIQLSKKKTKQTFHQWQDTFLRCQKESNVVEIEVTETVKIKILANKFIKSSVEETLQSLEKCVQATKITAAFIAQCGSIPEENQLDNKEMEFNYAVLQFEAVNKGDESDWLSEFYCEEVKEALEQFLPDKETFCIEDLKAENKVSIDVYSRIQEQKNFLLWKRFYESKLFENKWRTHAPENWMTKIKGIHQAEILIFQVYGEYKMNFKERIIGVSSTVVSDWVHDRLNNTTFEKALLRVVKVNNGKLLGAKMYFEKSKLPNDSVLVQLQFLLGDDQKTITNAIVTAYNHKNDESHENLPSATFNIWNYDGVEEGSICSVVEYMTDVENISNEQWKEAFKCCRRATFSNALELTVTHDVTIRWHADQLLKDFGEHQLEDMQRCVHASDMLAAWTETCKLKPNPTKTTTTTTAIPVAPVATATTTTTTTTAIPVAPVATATTTTTTTTVIPVAPVKNQTKSGKVKAASKADHQKLVLGILGGVFVFLLITLSGCFILYRRNSVRKRKMKALFFDCAMDDDMSVSSAKPTTNINNSIFLKHI